MEVENKVGEERSVPEAQNAEAGVEARIEPATLKRIAIVAAVALGGFLLGFVPMWLTSTGYQAERDTIVKTLRASVLQNHLATATINARRGEFEQARQQTSSFFTDLRAELESNEGAFVTEQHEAINAILEQRDDTITLLARNEAASADRLSDLYFNYLNMKTLAGAGKK